MSGSSKDAHREYMRRYRSSEDGAKKIKAARDEQRAWFNALKDRPCERCGESYPPYVMDFHHIDPETKKFGIGSNASVSSKAVLLAEIEKCVLLCANCHRIVEHG